MNNIKSKIRIVKNFPVPGVSYKDITPVIEDAKSYKKVIKKFADIYSDKKISKIAGIESRGFLFASSLAYELNTGLIMIRKSGKLPHKKITVFHSLEYGTSALEIHKDSVKFKENILIIDDVLATGGTAEAAIKLVNILKGNIVGLGFLLEVPLGGRKKLNDYPIDSLIKYKK